ncbi:MAG: 3-oxoacyl-[acyl-carrier-protein] synthase III C-terminal domain-containing protein [Candidatus Coatesbacteria bacterium]
MAGLGTAVPPLRISQADSLAFILANFRIREGTKSLYRRVMSHPGVAFRHVALAEPAEIMETDLDRIHARFQRWAVTLGAEALTRALAAAGKTPEELGFLATTTCTGTLCPGLSSYLAESCGLARGLAAVDLVGMGCGAALPALRQADSWVRTHPQGTAAVVAAEICTAAMFDGDSADLVISNSIFGDGAAAAVVGAPAAGRVSPRLVDFASATYPEWRESLRFRTEGGRLRNVLARDVPARAGEAVPALVRELLGRHSLAPDGVGHWLLHPGGANVLDAARDGLGVPEERLAASRRILRDYGNMSSPSCLFVLQEEIATSPPRAGELGVLAAFGAGFSVHAALVRFE